MFWSFLKLLNFVQRFVILNWSFLWPCLKIVCDRLRSCWLPLSVLLSSLKFEFRFDRFWSYFDFCDRLWCRLKFWTPFSLDSVERYLMSEGTQLRSTYIAEVIELCLTFLFFSEDFRSAFSDGLEVIALRLMLSDRFWSYWTPRLTFKTVPEVTGFWIQLTGRFWSYWTPSTIIFEVFELCEVPEFRLALYGHLDVIELRATFCDHLWSLCSVHRFAAPLVVLFRSF